jgi:type I site-specific restriction endonuclease
MRLTKNSRRGYLFQVIRVYGTATPPFHLLKVVATADIAHEDEALQRLHVCPKNELVALVSLLRRIVGLDRKLTSFETTVRQRFQDWVFTRHHGDAPKFSEEQMQWLHMVRDHIVTSFHITTDDLELTPFGGKGGLGRFHQLFGGEYKEILEELNEVLVA